MLSSLARIWNEIVVDGCGNVYINGGDFDAPGIIALVTPERSVRVVADGIAFPNGMAVAPDNKTLIVAESYGNRLTAFAVDADGNLSNRRVWTVLEGAAPDGLFLDAEGGGWDGEVPYKCWGGAELRTRRGECRNVYHTPQTINA